LGVVEAVPRLLSGYYDQHNKLCHEDQPFVPSWKRKMYYWLSNCDQSIRGCGITFRSCLIYNIPPPLDGVIRLYYSLQGPVVQRWVSLTVG
jgi:hypothetical protein